MTPDDIITRKDLEMFKQELFALLGKPVNGEQFGWLKNVEVRKLLGVSNGTLQNLRVNGSLAFSKVGGTYFYRRDDIEKMLAGGQKKSPRVKSK
ncbi:helix-turn-helix domain-containing protein [Mucilaginibacter sp. AW1-3]